MERQTDELIDVITVQNALYDIAVGKFETLRRVASRRVVERAVAYSNGVKLPPQPSSRRVVAT